MSKSRSIRYLARLTIAGLMAVSMLASVAEATTSGPVTFTVRKSHLRVRVLPHKTVSKGRPTYVWATIRNIGKPRLRAATVKIYIVPRAAHSKATQTLGTLAAGRTRKVAWRVVFPRSGVYRITVLARARRSLKIVYVSGGRRRIRVAAPKTTSLFIRLVRFILNPFPG